MIHDEMPLQPMAELDRKIRVGQELFWVENDKE
jgi:hypothetical protein